MIRIHRGFLSRSGTCQNGGPPVRDAIANPSPLLDAVPPDAVRGIEQALGQPQRHRCLAEKSTLGSSLEMVGEYSGNPVFVVSFP